MVNVNKRDAGGAAKGGMKTCVKTGGKVPLSTLVLILSLKNPLQESRKHTTMFDDHRRKGVSSNV